ncbi:UNKNOWN [Stylonychia lemnae]|uniref:Transmembrane protein n=1 Tax=Stylonychia lemnae TaxID=5949 RepID=A0A078A8L4_STYLE|nr:UNKNOWN [Stylonychia lemnae]|eukprot:CDW78615.1 UNKNOWN [Stylonychia lemnae]
MFETYHGILSNDNSQFQREREKWAYYEIDTRQFSIQDNEVYCQTYCQFQIQAELSVEKYLQAGQTNKFSIKENQELILKVYIPEDNETHTIEFIGASSIDRTKLTMILTPGNKVPNSQNGIFFESGWEDKMVLKITYSDQNSVIMFSSKLMGSVVDLNKQGGMSLDYIEQGMTQVYSYNIINNQKDLRLKLEVFSGNPNMYISPKQLPENIFQSIYNSKDHFFDEELRLTPQKRAENNAQSGIFMIAVYGFTRATYKITIVNEDGDNYLKNGLSQKFNDTKEIIEQKCNFKTQELADAPELRRNAHHIRVYGVSQNPAHYSVVVKLHDRIYYQQIKEGKPYIGEKSSEKDQLPIKLYSGQKQQAVIDKQSESLLFYFEFSEQFEDIMEIILNSEFGHLQMLLGLDYIPSSITYSEKGDNMNPIKIKVNQTQMRKTQILYILRGYLKENQINHYQIQLDYPNNGYIIQCVSLSGNPNIVATLNNSILFPTIDQFDLKSDANTPFDTIIIPPIMIDQFEQRQNSILKYIVVGVYSDEKNSALYDIMAIKNNASDIINILLGKSYSFRQEMGQDQFFKLQMKKIDSFLINVEMPYGQLYLDIIIKNKEEKPEIDQYEYPDLQAHFTDHRNFKWIGAVDPILNYSCDQGCYIFIRARGVNTIVDNNQQNLSISYIIFITKDKQELRDDKEIRDAFLINNAVIAKQYTFQKIQDDSDLEIEFKCDIAYLQTNLQIQFKNMLELDYTSWNFSTKDQDTKILIPNPNENQLLQFTNFQNSSLSIRYDVLENNPTNFAYNYIEVNLTKLARDKKEHSKLIESNRLKSNYIYIPTNDSDFCMYCQYLISIKNLRKDIQQKIQFVASQDSDSYMGYIQNIVVGRPNQIRMKQNEKTTLQILNAKQNAEYQILVQYFYGQGNLKVLHRDQILIQHPNNLVNIKENNRIPFQKFESINSVEIKFNLDQIDSYQVLIESIEELYCYVLVTTEYHKIKPIIDGTNQMINLQPNSSQYFFYVPSSSKFQLSINGKITKKNSYMIFIGQASDDLINDQRKLKQFDLKGNFDYVIRNSRYRDIYNVYTAIQTEMKENNQVIVIKVISSEQNLNDLDLKLTLSGSEVQYLFIGQTTRGHVSNFERTFMIYEVFINQNINKDQDQDLYIQVTPCNGMIDLFVSESYLLLFDPEFGVENKMKINSTINDQDNNKFGLITKTIKNVNLLNSDYIYMGIQSSNEFYSEYQNLSESYFEIKVSLIPSSQQTLVEKYQFEKDQKEIEISTIPNDQDHLFIKWVNIYENKGDYVDKPMSKVQNVQFKLYGSRNKKLFNTFQSMCSIQHSKEQSIILMKYDASDKEKQGMKIKKSDIQYIKLVGLVAQFKDEQTGEMVSLAYDPYIVEEVQYGVQINPKHLIIMIVGGILILIFLVFISCMLRVRSKRLLEKLENQRTYNESSFDQTEADSQQTN